jgi:hypothetical protein
MLGKTGALGKWKSAKSWQAACNQSNLWFINGLARRPGNITSPASEQPTGFLRVLDHLRG